MQNKLNILIVGAGMYVCGRGTSGYGSVLPMLYQASRNNIVGKVGICATSYESIKKCLNKNKELEKKFNRQLDIITWPDKKNTNNNKSYIDAVTSDIVFDCAIIVVPDHLHFEIAKVLISKKIHVIIVKPFTPDINSAIKLTEIADKLNVYGAVEFHKRYDKANINIRDLVQSKILGNILYINVEYSQRKVIPENIFKDWAHKTDIFQYLGVHYVDLIYFITKATPIRVMSIGQKVWLKSIKIDTYDSIQTIIEWKHKSNYFVSTILTNWIDPNKTSAMSDQKIKVIGTKGRIESDQKNRGMQIVTDVNGVEDVNLYFNHMYGSVDGESVQEGYGYDCFYSFLSNIISIKYTGKKEYNYFKNEPTFKSSIISTSVLEASRESLKSNSKWIDIDQRVQKYI